MVNTYVLKFYVIIILVQRCTLRYVYGGVTALIANVFLSLFTKSNHVTTFLKLLFIGMCAPTPTAQMIESYMTSWTNSNNYFSMLIKNIIGSLYKKVKGKAV